MQQWDVSAHLDEFDKGTSSMSAGSVHPGMASDEVTSLVAR